MLTPKILKTLFCVAFFKMLINMRKIFLTNIAILLLVAANAQYADSLTVKDYANSEQFLFYNVAQKIDRGAIKGNWMQGDKFWYRVLTAQGSEFVLVDATKGTRSAAFDQQKLAAALSSQAGKTYTANMLPFTNIEYTDDGKSIVFNANGKRWKADLKTYALTLETSTAANKSAKENELLSPDGSKAAFIKDYNLWVRDVATNQLTQLTTDGIQYFGYATDNAGWKHSNNPILRWSPDSKKIATFQQDERKAGDMYLVSTNVGHPTLKQWKYPLPGDSNIIMIQRVIINVDEPKVIRLQVAS